MKASRFTDAQKAFVVKQGEEGCSVSEICRKAGIAEATYYNWKKNCFGMLPSEMKRIKKICGDPRPVWLQACVLYAAPRGMVPELEESLSYLQ